MRRLEDARVPSSLELRSVSGSRDVPPSGNDLIAAVKGLHELTPQQLTKLIKDSGSSNVIRRISEDGSQIQIDITYFARHLPLHIIAVTMAWERDKTTFKYLLCGVLLLHAMCDLAVRVPKIEEILLDDMKVSEQLIDVVFYLIIVLGAHRQESLQAPNDLVLLHSALVACGLKLLTVIISPQYEEVVQVLTAYPKTETFIDAAFAAVCINVTVLQAKLSSQHVETRENMSPSDVDTLIHLCQQCECSLHFLKSCCDQKLFREFIVRNKRLCGNGGVLSLVQAVMKLKLSPQYRAPSYMSSVSRLKSQALSILQYLCEESATYLDDVVSTAQSRDLVESIALQVIELLKKMYSVKSKQLTAFSEITHLKGQLELNSMRVADIFSDDSNFRPFFMAEFPEVLVAILLVPHAEFLSGWCSSHAQLSEDNATLDIPREIYAHTITSLLIKVMANLHCFVSDVCRDDKGHFLSKFISLLMEEPREPSIELSPATVSQKTTTVNRNLRSLLSHAESLVPRFLNEEDLQLLRLFKSQYETTAVHGASEDHPIQDTRVHSSPMHIEAAAYQSHGDTSKEARAPKNVAFPEANQLNRIAKDLTSAGEMKHGMMEHVKTSGSNVNVREDERDYRTTEASGSDSSPRGTTDQMGGFHFKEEPTEDGRFNILQSDETHQRKRKRPMMNDKQISLIEVALVDEPNMHRNANSLKIWADKISLHGTEVTTSRLKNWLNNRKAKLARIAKDVRPSLERGNLDRQGSSGPVDLPSSPTDNSGTPSSAKTNVINEVTGMKYRVDDDKDLDTSVVKPCNNVPPIMHFEPGQYVVLVGETGEEIGKAKVFQVHGSWSDKNLEQSRICVVDIIELLVPRSTKLLHPIDATCNSFDEAEMRLGLMRVFWDLNKVFHLPPSVVN